MEHLFHAELQGRESNDDVLNKLEWPSGKSPGTCYSSYLHVLHILIAHIPWQGGYRILTKAQ